MKKEIERKNTEKTELASAEKKCSDIDCPIHGKLKIRGRAFEGKVIRKFPKRVTIEFERMNYVSKYERYARTRTRIHARLPICMEDKINIGDFIRVKECRPLSKIIHFAVIEKIKNSEDKK